MANRSSNLVNACQTTVILTQDLSDKLRLESCLGRTSGSAIIRKLLEDHYKGSENDSLAMAQK